MSISYDPRRAMRESLELKAARKLLASAAGGIPLLHGPINRVLQGLGLEVSRKETPAQKIDRVRAALARYDSLTPLNVARQGERSRAGRWVASVADTCLSGIRGCFGKRK
jgi:hypothetical protein